MVTTIKNSNAQLTVVTAIKISQKKVKKQKIKVNEKLGNGNDN